MQNQCFDNFSTNFTSYSEMHDYHANLERDSKWKKHRVNSLHFLPLDQSSALYANPSSFAAGTSYDAIEDTTRNLGLALKLGGQIYPVRMTAYKSILERAKISGTALPKLSRKNLARTLNDCLDVHRSDALVLIRDEKVSAVHSGDPTDYSVLTIDRLLETIQSKLDLRFPGNQFQAGYRDHSITSASWIMPNQTNDLLGTYQKHLISSGRKVAASKLVPGIRFITSDIGVSSAKIAAMLEGSETPIHIGGCIAVDHRHNTTIDDFNLALDQLFAQYQNSIKQLQKLLKIELDYPVNTMTRVCKRLSLPKKAAAEAIRMFEMTFGGGPATAHDVYIAMQEIPYLLKAEHVSESKLLSVEENMARALTLRWSDYDLAKAVNY